MSGVRILEDFSAYYGDLGPGTFKNLTRKGFRALVILDDPTGNFAVALRSKTGRLIHIYGDPDLVRGINWEAYSGPGLSMSKIAKRMRKGLKKCGN